MTEKRDKPKAAPLPERHRDRDAILARRRFFVASALAGIVAGACDKPSPHPCLKVASPPAEDAAPASSVEAPPGPCLEIAAPPDDDAGNAYQLEARDAGPDARDGSTPRPCLSPALRRDAGPPRACLKMAPDEGF